MDAVAALRDVYTKVLVAHCIRIKRRKASAWQMEKIKYDE